MKHKVIKHKVVNKKMLRAFLATPGHENPQQEAVTALIDGELALKNRIKDQAFEIVRLRQTIKELLANLPYFWRSTAVVGTIQLFTNTETIVRAIEQLEDDNGDPPSSDSAS